MANNSEKQSVRLREWVEREVTPVDKKLVLKVAGRWCEDYLNKVIRGDRKNPEILKRLEVAITIRKDQERERIKALKKFNYKTIENEY